MEIDRTVISKGEELSVVNFLMSYVQTHENIEIVRKSIQYLVKQLEQRNNELNSLITVVCTNGALSNNCVTLPRPTHQIWPIAGHFVSYPHVLYARIWRWPDLLKEELQHVEPCRFGFDVGGDHVCINPYHYEKKLWMRNEAPWFDRQHAMRAFQDQNFVNDLYLTRESRADVWPVTRTLNHLTLYNLPDDILASLIRQCKDNMGIPPEGNWGHIGSPAMQLLGDNHELCRLDERNSTFLVDGIRCALRFMEGDDDDDLICDETPKLFDTASVISSTSDQSYHSERPDSPVPSTSVGQGRSRFADDSTGSEEIGGAKKKILRQDSQPTAGPSQERLVIDAERRAKNEKFDETFNLNKLDKNVTQDILTKSVEFFAEDKVLTKSVLESRRCPSHGESEEYCIFEDMDSPLLGPLATLAIDCAMTPILEDEAEVELYYDLQGRRRV